MGAPVPKQFIPVKGVPVLMRTLQAFHDFDAAMPLVLVLPKDQQDYWRSLCEEYRFALPHTIADGGVTRCHSVMNGLAAIDTLLGGTLRCGSEGETRLVAVHDGVRPFVAREVIGRCFDAAMRDGAAIPVVNVVETVRELSDDGSSLTRDRSRFRLVQTPQVFDAPLLARAYDHVSDDCSAFTDDASVVEALAHPITLVEGNRENIKITTPYDLTVAEALCTI